jgi:RNA polymerase sigma-54 factor
MTPQLQQAIRLLQLSSLELQAEIQEVLETNPLLDVEEDYSFDNEEATKDNSDSDEAVSKES